MMFIRNHLILLVYLLILQTVIYILRNEPIFWGKSSFYIVRDQIGQNFNNSASNFRWINKFPVAQNVYLKTVNATKAGSNTWTTGAARAAAAAWNGAFGADDAHVGSVVIIMHSSEIFFL